MDATGPTPKLQEAMERAMEASRERNARDRIDLSQTCVIDIPAQKVQTKSTRHAQIIIRTLKGVGVHGTYTIRR